MAQNSYGWVNPIAQPAVPVTPRYGTTQTQGDYYQQQAAMNSQNKAAMAKASGLPQQQSGPRAGAAGMMSTQGNSIAPGYGMPSGGRTYNPNQGGNDGQYAPGAPPTNTQPFTAPYQDPNGKFGGFGNFLGNVGTQN